MTDKTLMRAFEEAPDGVIEDIAPNTVWASLTRYLRIGQSGLECVRLALLAARTDDPKRILDFACGYGRVLRTFKAAYPEAELVACDINEEGVDFCASVFDAKPVYSKEDPSKIEIDGDFDLIWCGSLLTHLDAPRWKEFLGLFESLLSPDGVIVFTTHGRHVANTLRAGGFYPPPPDSTDEKWTFGLKPHQVETLLSDHDATGFGYVRYDFGPVWGIALSSPSWVCALLEEMQSLSLIGYTERAFGAAGMQDSIACQRPSAWTAPGRQVVAERDGSEQ